MIYKINFNGQKSILNMPVGESEKTELVAKWVGDTVDCVGFLKYEMYFNEEREVEDHTLKVASQLAEIDIYGMCFDDEEDFEERTLNTVASQLAGFAIYGNVVIFNDDMAPLTADDIVFIDREIEARKHHNVIYPSPDHEIDY